VPKTRAGRGAGPHALALALYAGLAIVYTWPVVRNLSGSIADDPGDNLGGVHTLWWVWSEVSAFDLPWRIDLYGFPGSSIVFHPSPLMETLSLPFTGLLGPVAAFNLLLLLSFILTGYTAFLLVRRVSGSDLAGLAGGALFTGTGPHQFDLLFNTNAIWALPLVCLAFLAWRDDARRWPLVALAAVALGLSNFYFAAYFLPPVFLIFAPWRRMRERRALATWVASAGATITALAIVYVPPLIAAGDSTRDQLDAVASDAGSRPPTELMSLVIGSPDNPILGGLWTSLGTGLDPTQAPNTGSAYAGWVVLILAAVGLTAGRRALPWVVLSAIGFVMLLGPELQIRGERILPLPYALAEHVPVMSYLRAPGRFYALMALGLIVLAGVGLTRLRPRIGAAWPPVVIVLTVVGLADSWFSAGIATTPSRVPPIYETLAELPGRPAVIEAPGGGFNDYEWLGYQRVSKLPMVNDAGPRSTTLAPIPLNRNPFLRRTVAGPLPSDLATPPADPEAAAALDRRRGGGVPALAAAGVGYAILHKQTIFGWADPGDAGYGIYRAYLERHLGPPVHEDHDVVLFALPGAPRSADFSPPGGPG
jgi:hypothetical protein